MSEYRRRLKQDFSSASLSYGKFSTVQQQNYIYAFEFLSRSFKLPFFEILQQAAVAKAVDIGVGSGAGLAGLLHYFQELEQLDWYMCDLSQGMLSANQLHFPKVCADIAQMPWQNNTFSISLSNFALHWSDNIPAALSELIRITQPGGFVLLSLPLKGSFHILETAWHSQGLSSPLHPMPEQSSLKNELRRLSFPVSTQRRQLNLSLRTPRACFDWLRKTGVKRKSSPENRMTKSQYGCIVESLSEQLASGQTLSFEMMDIIISK